MSSPQQRLKNIKNSIDDIEFILNSVEFKISQAIEDKILKPAIRMHIIKIAEQFNKLKDDNAFDVLEKFSSNDLKGISAVRNFIAHDYDSVDDSIIEDVPRINMPIIKAVVVKELGLS
jgi:uncharacterized protein with HEPN domain